ncbi:MAG: hypothetical protein JOZ54_21990 [Acidobacteria bacterium]|nr:hypothetical protein [Acidobacteriota bacterium]
MASKRTVDVPRVGAILREWHDTKRSLYAVVFADNGMRTCAGCISAVDDHTAVIADPDGDLPIPYATAGDCAVVTLGKSERSVTLTWHNGNSAFVATRT